MSTGDRLLLLVGGAGAKQGLDCARQARARGLRIWLTDTAENLAQAPDVVALAEQVTVLPYHDAAACVAWATDRARRDAFIGVFGFREFAVEAAAAVAEALGLPGNPLPAVRCVRDKLACRRALQELGFRQPAAALCSSRGEALAFAAAHPPGPWIVKPPAAMASLGVSLVADPADWGPAIAHVAGGRQVLTALFERQGMAVESQPDAARGSFLVECFQPGDEFSAEGLFVYGQPHVLVLTAKRTTSGPHFVELGHAMPAELDPAVTRAAAETVEAALRSLGLRWGVFHVEFWLDGGRPVLGEVHVRAGGDYIHFMTQHVTGIELFGAVFDQLLGRRLEPADWRPRRGAAVRYLDPPPGRVTAIDGWDAVREDPACLVANGKLQVGDLVPALRCSLDRSSFVVTTGGTTPEAVLAADRLCAAVRVEVAP
ncbi:MAG TPA: ATP-grasp domain-containing protein [Chloroflexota bacterium]|nr:ATP-grasp domain-containing protein [Chloroflexota bacterium]